MKKLIVNNEHEAPANKVATLLAIWATLAELLDKVTSLPNGYHLAWELSIQHYGDHEWDEWEAYCSVRMVFQAKVGEIKNQTQYVDVPVTDVHEIMLYEGDGTFCWHSDCKKPMDDLKTIGLIAEAVVKGKLPSGHHYEYNWLPPRKTSK